MGTWLPGGRRCAAAAGLASLLLILMLQHWLPKVPGALIAVVASIAGASVLDLADHGVGLVGPLPQGFPPFSIPRTS